ncbi:glycosyltransferase family 2 protein [Moheibacter sediminis]|uniref:Glycosyl transferase family 2 n=1 Tax=Moheibacter sediminis TaxID=1434700 RepID=A0A1W2ALA9_9FLAO|nr:glycosyltransferase family 2 protein [Moheibacter sediminis]SMC61330.1 Glycosyl transferase family 2 [Moheibacter sediminis]
MNENLPLFSILIAHYNNWDYFQDCYKSILSQTYKNYEIVIVDDFSTDDSYNQLVGLAQKDSKITLVRNHVNKGVGFTKKKCIDLSKGEICGFLDPDDALIPTALEEVMNMYKLHDKNGVVYSKMMLCDKNLNPDKPFSRAKKITNGDKWFFNIDTNVAHFFTFKKAEYYKTLGIDEALRSAEDQDLYLKLYEVTNFYFIDKCLYLYRLHSDGISQASQKLAAKDYFKQVLRDAFERRNITVLNGHYVAELDNAQLYSAVVINHNKLSSKLLRKIRTFLS